MGRCIKCHTMIGAQKKCERGYFFKQSSGYWRCCACVIEKHAKSVHYQKWYNAKGCKGCKSVSLSKPQKQNVKPSQPQSARSSKQLPPPQPLPPSPSTDPVGYYSTHLDEIKDLSADFLTDQMCLNFVKANPLILKHLHERYRTEIVCLTAFLKSRSLGYQNDIVKHIPFGIRCPEMWEIAIENCSSNLFDVPFNSVTLTMSHNSFKHFLASESKIKLSWLTKKQREIFFTLLFEHVTNNKLSFFSDFIERETLPEHFTEMVDFMITLYNNNQKIHLDLYQFKDIQLTGSQANQLGKNMKFTKLTNFTEKHRHCQYQDGQIYAEKPFDIYEPEPIGSIYITTMCKEHIWSQYKGNDIGDLCWRRPVILPPNASVCVRSDHYIKCDTCILGKREKI